MFTNIVSASFTVPHKPSFFVNNATGVKTTALACKNVSWNYPQHFWTNNSKYVCIVYHKWPNFTVQETASAKAHQSMLFTAK